MNKKINLSNPNYSKRIRKALNKMLITFLQKYKLKKLNAIKLSEFENEV